MTDGVPRPSRIAGGGDGGRWGEVGEHHAISILSPVNPKLKKKPPKKKSGSEGVANKKKAKRWVNIIFCVKFAGTQHNFCKKEECLVQYETIQTYLSVGEVCSIWFVKATGHP